MLNIYIIYNANNTQVKDLGEEYTSPKFFYIDESTYKGRKESWKVKSKLSAKLTPFVAVFEDTKPIRAFYSEASKDPIGDLINYLNDSRIP
jgi:hypothetical protein